MASSSDWCNDLSASWSPPAPPDNLLAAAVPPPLALTILLPECGDAGSEPELPVLDQYFFPLSVHCPAAQAEIMDRLRGVVIVGPESASRFIVKVNNVPCPNFAPVIDVRGKTHVLIPLPPVAFVTVTQSGQFTAQVSIVNTTPCGSAEVESSVAVFFMDIDVKVVNGAAADAWAVTHIHDLSPHATLTNCIPAATTLKETLLASVCALDAKMRAVRTKIRTKSKARHADILKAYKRTPKIMAVKAKKLTEEVEGELRRSLCRMVMNADLCTLGWTAVHVVYVMMEEVEKRGLEAVQAAVGLLPPELVLDLATTSGTTVGQICGKEFESGEVTRTIPITSADGTLSMRIRLKKEAVPVLFRVLGGDEDKCAAISKSPSAIAAEMVGAFRSSLMQAPLD